MSVMDMFRQQAVAKEQMQQQQTPHTTQTAPATAQAQPGQQQAGQSFQAPAGQATTEVSPLDQFKELWKNEVDPAKQQEQFNPEKLFTLDPKQIQEQLAGVDFTKSITQEEMQAMLSGGEGAMAALASVLNKSSRETMGAAMAVSAKMIESATSRAVGASEKRTQEQIRLSQVSSQMQELNPAVSHPAVAPVFELLKTQFTQNYPNASASEIAQLASQYVEGMANVLTGKKDAAQEEAGAGGGTNWAEFYLGPKAK